MQKDSLSNLPEVMVEFSAFEVSDTRVVLFNKELAMGGDECQILREYSYRVSSAAENLENGSVDSKLFFAERYGGEFISRNGGGGRCGFDGLFQLKGIGRTPLVGAHNDAVHSNGMLDLESAIHEAIWGEVIQIALPYGAARTVAVIRLNESFVLDGRTHARALLVREAVVRPAHFERATLFKEDVPLGASLSNDARRVQRAMQRIHEFLPQSRDSDFTNASNWTSIDSFRCGIAELARRYASQFAVARCKNIMHMMMSSSNLTITGGWLDLNSVTVVSPISVREKRLFKRFEAEHLSAIKSIENICYYAKKYLMLSDQYTSGVFNSALDEFQKCYELEMRKNSLIRAGFPHFVVEAMAGTEEFKHFSDVLIMLMKQQTYELGLEKVFGGLRFFSVPERPCVRNVCVDKAVSIISIDWRVSDRHLSDQLDQTFELFVAATLRKANVSMSSLIRILSINLTRFSVTPVLLQNVKLYDFIKGSIRNANSDWDFKEQINALASESKDAADICLKTDTKLAALMWKSGGDFIEYDGVLDVFRVRHEGTQKLAAWAQLVALSKELPMAKNVVDFYGPVQEALREV
ncbi:hypothetical protein ACYZTM_25170 [Pseudomonas sp. MDT2-39-1]